MCAASSFTDREKWLPPVKTRRRRAFINVGLAARPREAIRTRAVVSIGRVDASPAILAWVWGALIDVYVTAWPWETRRYLVTHSIFSILIRDSFLPWTHQSEACSLVFFKQLFINLVNFKGTIFYVFLNRIFFFILKSSGATRHDKLSKNSSMDFLRKKKKHI